MNELQEILEGFENLDKLSIAERLDFFRKVSTVAVVKTQDVPEQENSICPYTKKEIVKACEMSECMYWVGREGCNNCALNFLLKEGSDQLNVQQVAYLYEKSPQRIESIYKNCFKIVQRHYLRSRLRELKVPQFIYKPGFCITCESHLLPEDAEPQLLLGGGFGYCSTGCKKQHPPLYFEIERFFEAEFKNVLQVASDIFSTYYVEEILGFQPNILRNRIEKQKASKKL